MIPFENILVAIDTDQDQHTVLTETVRIADQDHARLTVVDVVPESTWPKSFPNRDCEHLEQRLIVEKSKKIHEITEFVRERGIGILANILRGNKSVELIEEAIRNQCDLIVCAKEGDKQEKTSVGHFAHRLIRRSPIPVWLVKKNSYCRNVLICLDTSSERKIDAKLNESILAIGLMIQRFLADAKLDAVHVCEVYGMERLKTLSSPEKFEALIDDFEQNASQSLDSFLDRQSKDVESSRRHVPLGYPETEIPKLAEQLATDLVIVGSVGHSAIAGMLLGDTAGKILNHVDCSVLVVKRDSPPKRTDG